MDVVRVSAYGLVLFLFNNTAIADSDPVSWQLTPATNPISIQVGEQAGATYTLTSHLPGPALITTKISSSGNFITFQDQCNQKTLRPGNSCKIQVLFSPTAAGKGFFQLTYKYNFNVIPLPAWEATATSVPQTPALTGNYTEPTPFPNVFYTNQAPFVIAQFSNTGNTTLTNCVAGNSLGQNELTINPISAATVTTDVPFSGTCGTTGSPITLNPGDPPCAIYGELSNLQITPTATLTAQVTCNEVAASIQKTFAIQNPSGGCTTASVIPNLPLPTETYLYADNMVTFLITNNCATDNINLGVVDIAATTGNATITGTNANPPATYDNCSNQMLTPGQSCTITASVIPTPPINISGLVVTASVPTGGLSPETGSTTAPTVSSNIQPTHHILFVNQCPFDVWYGIANGNGTSCPGIACKSPDPNLISFPSGAPESAYYLEAQTPNSPPSTIDLALTSYQNGAFWPRTGCIMQGNQFNCTTGTCQTMPNSATCRSSSGGGPVQPQNPFTKFEATIVSTPGGDGVYDVSAINGMTVPVEVKAFGPSTGNTSSTVYTHST